MTERNIVKIEYENGGVKVFLDNGDILSKLSSVETSQNYDGCALVNISAYVVKPK